MEQSPDGQQPPAKYLCMGCEGDYRNHGTNAVYLCNFSDTSGNKPKNMSEFTSDKLEGFLLSIIIYLKVNALFLLQKWKHHFLSVPFQTTNTKKEKKLLHG